MSEFKSTFIYLEERWDGVVHLVDPRLDAVIPTRVKDMPGYEALKKGGFFFKVVLTLHGSIVTDVWDRAGRWLIPQEKQALGEQLGFPASKMLDIFYFKHLDAEMPAILKRSAQHENGLILKDAYHVVDLKSVKQHQPTPMREVSELVTLQAEIDSLAEEASKIKDQILASEKPRKKRKKNQ